MVAHANLFSTKSLKNIKSNENMKLPVISLVEKANYFNTEHILNFFLRNFSHYSQKKVFWTIVTIMVSWVAHVNLSLTKSLKSIKNNENMRLPVISLVKKANHFNTEHILNFFLRIF